MAYSLSILRDQIKARLQVLEDGLELLRADSGLTVDEDDALENALREVRDLQTEITGQTTRVDLADEGVTEILASAQRTGDTNTADFTNEDGTIGLVLVLDITVAVSGQINNLILQRKDPDGTYTTVETIATGGLAATGRFVFVIYPGAVESTPERFTAFGDSAIPHTYRIQVDHNSESSDLTYTLDEYRIR